MTLASDITPPVEHDTPVTVLQTLANAAMALPRPIQWDLRPGVRDITIHCHRQAEADLWRRWMTDEDGAHDWTTRSYIAQVDPAKRHHHRTATRRGWTVDITWITREEEPRV